eukprot:CAMPEP_0119006564 /NCGR_PEP_ID=MMETSP1176-20130426/2371_1 /TAXON_ID=265551 /ORGANISM="Synedropsis recta cf, Strain CCMP1620" /LENGTH=634 /DNA_ID=CAMNT_0006958493 /DNA_START=14 /DNA_END=1918 /DNA_ORIENTATION=-
MSFFSGSGTAAKALFGDSVTNIAESMLSQASEAIGIPAEQQPKKEKTEEELFQTSLGYFTFPSDPLSLVCQTLKEKKDVTEISTETFVLELNPAKVFAKELRDNQSVTTLKLISESGEEVLEEESAQVLAKAMNYCRSNLQEIHLTVYPDTEQGMVYLLQAVQYQTKLERLTMLSHFLARTDSCSTILQESKTLNELTIQCLGADEPNFASLAKAVMTNASLEKLVLVSYRQNPWGNDPGQLELLLDAVAMSLEHFEVHNLFLGTKGSKSLSAILEQSITTKLVLRNCHLPNLRELEPSFMGNTSLTHLDLGGGRTSHGVGDDGAMVLANLLKSNSDLVSLHLQHAGMGDNGTVFLGNALHTNRTLQKLDLRHNDQVGQAGLVAIGNALKDNSSLTEFLLLETMVDPLPVAGLQGLAEGLSKNTTLKSLGDFPKTRNKEVKRQLDRLELLIKFNNEANYEAKATFISEYSTRTPAPAPPLAAAPPTTSAAPNNTTITFESATSATMQVEDSKCSMCNRYVKGQVMKCKSIFEPHVICVGCMELHFSQNLGQQTIACPVLGCTNSQPFVVKEDLYGKVSAFYYEQHCKEMFTSVPASPPAKMATMPLAPAVAAALTAPVGPSVSLGETDLSDLLG